MEKHGDIKQFPKLFLNKRQQLLPLQSAENFIVKTELPTLYHKEYLKVLITIHNLNVRFTCIKAKKLHLESTGGNWLNKTLLILARSSN